MNNFLNTDPLNLLKDQRVIFKYAEFKSHLNENDYCFLLKDGDYLIWAKTGLGSDFGGTSREWVGGTELEIPKEGLSWFIKVIEEKFFKAEAEGGLPKDKFSYEEEIKGERLVVSRMFGKSGYAVRNHSRFSYLFEGSTEPQEAIFSDEFLFEKDFFSQLKLIAEKINKE